MIRSTSYAAAFVLLLLACGHEPPPAAAPTPSSASSSEHEHEHAHDHGPLVHRFESAEKWAKEFDEAYAAKLRAGLGPNGKVFIVDFTLEAKHGPPPHHRLAADQVVRELTAGGLTAQVSPTSLPEQYIVVGARP
jgi:pyruvate/2-oxoglutarate dehydrogenase complex dihydrolipoamide acyltransferase (E2) component